MSDEPVHAVLLARGDASRGGTRAALRIMSNMLAWARRPERLRFHLLIEDHSHALVAAEAAHAGLRVSPVNASDTTLEARLPPLGLAMLRHSALQNKPRMYTAPKLFLHALLPADVQRVLVLDTDLLVLDDLCDAWDAFARRCAAEPRTLLGYAREQQPGYRQLTANRTQGYNGGVGLQNLQALRASTPTSAEWARGLASALDSKLLRRGGPLAGDSSGAASWTSGDQDLLVLMEMLAPSAHVWDTWMWPLPCEWNWQLCYSIIAAEGNRGHAAGVDDTCTQPPRLLHFNCLRAFKDLVKKERLELASDTNATTHNAILVRRALRSAHPARTCRAAARRLPSVQARHCNVTYLFERSGATAVSTRDGQAARRGRHKPVV